MKNRMVHTTNPTRLLHIDSKRLDVTLNHDAGRKVKSFSVNKIDLKDLVFPVDSIVWLWYSSRYDERYVSIGTPDNLVLAKDVSLEHFNLNAPVYFRLNIFNKSNPALIASSNNIRGRCSESPEGSIPLLPVRVVNNMGDIIWQFVLDNDGPRIDVNDDPQINVASRLENDWMFRSLIVPEALKQGLEFVVKEYDESCEWHNHWKMFVETQGEEFIEFKNGEDRDAVNEYVNSIVHKWCRNVKFKEKLVDLIGG